MQRNPTIRLNEFHGGGNVLIPLPSRDPSHPQSRVLSAPAVQQYVLPLRCEKWKHVGTQEQYETNDNQRHPTAITCSCSLQFPALSRGHVVPISSLLGRLNQAFGKLALTQCRNPRVAHPRCQAAAGPQRKRW